MLTNQGRLTIGHKHQTKGASVVYWVRHESHTDMHTQGYIGITSQRVLRRWNEHERAAINMDVGRCDALNNAIRKHNDKIVFQVLLVANTRQYCEQVEGMLRPHKRIGWNIAIGGLDVNPDIGGEANRKRILQYWKDNPIIVSDRWWNEEMRVLRLIEKRKRNAKRLADKAGYVPYTSSRRIAKHTSSGVLGVSWFGNYQQWRSQISVHKKQYLIGYFKSKDAASNAHQSMRALAIKLRKNEITVEAFEIALKSCKNMFES